MASVGSDSSANRRMKNWYALVVIFMMLSCHMKLNKSYRLTKIYAGGIFAIFGAKSDTSLFVVRLGEI